jgi:protein TonB
LAQKVEKPKKTIPPQIIKIALITPILKKVVKKKSVTPQPLITPPIPRPRKIKKRVKHKKRKHKKVIKRKIKKKRFVKKKIRKKTKVKKIVKKKITKKKIVKKRVLQPKRIKKRVVKVVKRVEPIIEEVYYIPTPQPKKVVAIVKEPVYRKPTFSTKPQPQRKPQRKIDKSVEKREFLSQVRGKIINNKKYPKMALRRHIQGAVKVKFDITSSGNVSNIQFINGKSILQKSVRKAIRNSFPIGVPNNIKSELPIHDIYITIHFNIR